LPDGTFDRDAAVPLELAPWFPSWRRVFINGFCSPGANRREYPGAGTGFRLRALHRAA
jgi:hypothetical protein